MKKQSPASKQNEVAAKTKRTFHKEEMVQKGSALYNRAKAYQSDVGCSWPRALHMCAIESEADSNNNEVRTRTVSSKPSSSKKQKNQSSSKKKTSGTSTKKKKNQTKENNTQHHQPVEQEENFTQRSTRSHSIVSVKTNACSGLVLREDSKLDCLISHMPTTIDKPAVETVLRRQLTGSISAIYDAWKADDFDFLDTVFTSESQSLAPDEIARVLQQHQGDGLLLDQALLQLKNNPNASKACSALFKSKLESMICFLSNFYINGAISDKVFNAIKKSPALSIQTFQKKQGIAVLNAFKQAGYEGLTDSFQILLMDPFCPYMPKTVGFMKQHLRMEVPEDRIHEWNNFLFAMLERDRFIPHYFELLYVRACVDNFTKLHTSTDFWKDVAPDENDVEPKYKEVLLNCVQQEKQREQNYHTQDPEKIQLQKSRQQEALARQHHLMRVQEQKQERERMMQEQRQERERMLQAKETLRQRQIQNKELQRQKQLHASEEKLRQLQETAELPGAALKALQEVEMLKQTLKQQSNALKQAERDRDSASASAASSRASAASSKASASSRHQDWWEPTTETKKYDIFTGKMEKSLWA